MLADISAADLRALALAFLLCIAWLRLCDALAARGALAARDSRKLVHIGTGPIFLLPWLAFSAAPAARLLAALVPLAITLRFAAVGLGLLEDAAAVAALSRSGAAAELLAGPCLYGALFVAATLLGWRSSPAAVVALCTLCGGDGLADVVGRRLGSGNPLPHSRGKSWAGSAAFVAGALACALPMLAAFAAEGHLASPPAWQTGCVVLAAAAIESLPLEDVDNATVFAAAVLFPHFAFGWQ
jgi:phytol kinase